MGRADEDGEFGIVVSMERKGSRPDILVILVAIFSFLIFWAWMVWT